MSFFLFGLRLGSTTAALAQTLVEDYLDCSLASIYGCCLSGAPFCSFCAFCAF